jgi:chromate transporter
MMKIDLFAFGGGFSSIPLMLHEIVDARRWMDPAAFMDGIALGQVTPGPIVIIATFVGYAIRGPLGAVIATTSIFLPSFLMVIVTTPFFSRFAALPCSRKRLPACSALLSVCWQALPCGWPSPCREAFPISFSPARPSSR